jgi:hypothetical protein
MKTKRIPVVFWPPPRRVSVKITVAKQFDNVNPLALSSLRCPFDTTLRLANAPQLGVGPHPAPRRKL